MAAGTMLLTIAAILVFCGLAQRALDRMHLTDKQALMLIGAMLAGTFLPDLRLGSISISIGGALIPFGVCVYLFSKADDRAERLRSLAGILLTGGAVYALSAFMPAEAEALPFDPIWLYGVLAGIIAWLLGRSRRCAFICGVTGVMLADAAAWMTAAAKGYQANLSLGGAGIADAIVISGILAVLTCELVGETLERAVRPHVRKGDSI